MDEDRRVRPESEPEQGDKAPEGVPPGRLRATILSGSGRFADPWHPFEETSRQLAGILEGRGFATEIADPDERMAELEGVDLLVVNIGAPSVPELHHDAANRRGLLRHLAAGRPVLALHSSVTSLPSVPEWESILGGIWVRGTTMHPDFGTAAIRVYPRRHPIVSTIGDFELQDERYSFLRVAEDVVPLATHQHEGTEHPILWARSYPAPRSERMPPGQAPAQVPVGGVGSADASREARVVYDALGHDGRSFDSPEHREILGRAADWLVGRLAAE